MKKVFGLLFFIFLLNGCDDGDLILETINFEDINVQSCEKNNILYKLKENEVLLLDINENVFLNKPTSPDKPIVIDINSSTNRLFYRFYNGPVSSENICNIIAPTKPIVTAEWVAISGKIEITTTVSSTPDNIPGSTKISGYNHQIVLKNITYQKETGTQVVETSTFGNYFISNTPPTLSFKKVLNQCSDTKEVYLKNNNEILTLENIDPSLIVNTETPIDRPRKALIGEENNTLTYTIFSKIFEQNYSYCNKINTTLPEIKEVWKAAKGVENISGIIEVSTIKNGTNAFIHTITIKNATLKSKDDKTSFKMGDAFLYGELTTSL